jgi:hypothetical protein
MSDFETDYACHKELRAKANEINKAVLFDALASTSITSIHVEFDGYGDSGQINGVSAFAGDQPADLPATKLTLQQLRWGQTDATPSDLTLEAAIEALCYDYLEQTHDGWENNDGGYGEFCIDVAKRSIELEFNGRFTDTWTDNHTF